MGLLLMGIKTVNSIEIKLNLLVLSTNSIFKNKKNATTGGLVNKNLKGNSHKPWKAQTYPHINDNWYSVHMEIVQYEF